MEKDPNPIAKGMSWMKTNMKMSMDYSDKKEKTYLLLMVVIWELNL